MNARKRKLKAAETAAALTGENHLCGWQPCGRASPRRDYFEMHSEPEDRLDRRKRLLGAHDGTFLIGQHYWLKTSCRLGDAGIAGDTLYFKHTKWQLDFWMWPYFDLRNLRVIYRRCRLLKGHQGGHQWEPREAWRK